MGLWYDGYSMMKKDKTTTEIEELWTLSSIRGQVNLANLFLIALIYFGVACRLAYKIGFSSSFQDGQYLKFTYEMEGKWWFRIMVNSLSAYVCIVAFLMYLFVVWGKEEKDTWQFLDAYFWELVALVGLVQSLMLPETKIKKQTLCP